MPLPHQNLKRTFINQGGARASPTLSTSPARVHRTSSIPLVICGLLQLLFRGPFCVGLGPYFLLPLGPVSFRPGGSGRSFVSFVTFWTSGTISALTNTNRMETAKISTARRRENQHRQTMQEAHCACTDLLHRVS